LDADSQSAWWGLNILIEYGYDGTGFFGSQIQPDKPTVSGAIEDALTVLYGRRIRINPASRTDRGVHARHTGATLTIPESCGPPATDLAKALNAHLPANIRIQRVSVVPDGYRARFEALAKEYRYRWREGKLPDIFETRYRAFVPARLDRNRVRDAIELMAGRHSFEHFCRRRAGQMDFLCSISGARVLWRGTRGEFRITGDRFLHQMVRRIVAAIFEIGQGRLDTGDFSRALFEGKPLKRVDVAPAEGLVLWKVYFREFGDESNNAFY